MHLAESATNGNADAQAELMRCARLADAYVASAKPPAPACRTNASFVSYGNHGAALVAIQHHYPNAFTNGTPTETGWQIITVPNTPQKELNKCAAVRKLRKGKQGHAFPATGY